MKKLKSLSDKTVWYDCFEDRLLLLDFDEVQFASYKSFKFLSTDKRWLGPDNKPWLTIADPTELMYQAGFVQIGVL